MAAVVVAIGIGALTRWRPTMAGRQPQSRDERLFRFTLVADALQIYDATHRQLPGASKCDSSGNTLYSWRVSLWPFAEGVKGLDLDAHWTAPGNRSAAAQPNWLYCDFTNDVQGQGVSSTVAAIIGPDTAIRSIESPPLHEVPCDTIVLIEARVHADNWMASGDVSLVSLDSESIGLVGYDDVIVVFADGEVWSLSRDVPISSVRRFATVRGSEQRDREAELGIYKLAARRSRIRARCSCGTKEEATGDVFEER